MSTGSEMETLSAATQRLQAAGYTGNWFATEDGRLALGEGGATLDPAEVHVDEVVRFEGISDPDDSSVLFALRTEAGERGLYIVIYGPYTPNSDAALMRALHSDD